MGGNYNLKHPCDNKPGQRRGDLGRKMRDSLCIAVNYSWDIFQIKSGE